MPLVIAVDTRGVVPRARAAHKRPARRCGVDRARRRPHVHSTVADPPEENLPGTGDASMSDQDASAAPSNLPFVPEPGPRVLLRPLPEPDDLPGLTALGPVPSERKARDWALVLQSQSTWHIIRRSYAGWILLVRDEDYAAASRSIDRYEAENADLPPRPTRERSRHA